MEASGIGQGQGDSGQQGDGESGGGLDYAALQQSLDATNQSVGEMREFLQSNPWQQVQNAEPDAEQSDDGLGELDLDYLDPETAAMMEPAELQQRLTQTITQAAERIADQRVAPLQEGLDEIRRENAVNALVGEFPEFGEPETAQQVVEAADQLAESMNQPHLANEPDFWRLVYMAGRAADAAQEEQGEVPAPASLESGAGATPGGGGGDLGDQIIGAGRAGSSVLPF